MQTSPQFLLVAATLLACSACAPHRTTQTETMRTSISPAALEQNTRPRLAQRLLEPMVGSWTTVSRFHPNPDAVLEVAEGQVETRWVLNQSFLEEQVAVNATTSGAPFRGLGIMGYSPASDQYRSVWIDNRSNEIGVSSGTVDPSGRIFTLNGRYNDARTGKEIETRQVVTIVSDDTRTLDMFEQPRGGKEMKTLEVTYTRRRL